MLYERFRDDVRQLQKDPSPEVRSMALHVERDASEIELIQSRMEQAVEQGWRYSDADWLKRSGAGRRTPITALCKLLGGRLPQWPPRDPRRPGTRLAQADCRGIDPDSR
jgi:hypothetical protein